MEVLSPAEDNVSQPRPISRHRRLLVSVRDAEEAVAALEGGADWIDLKEPLAGPLGAVDAEIANRVVGCVAGRRPLSAALGELVDWQGSASRNLLDVEGINAVKLGLAGCANRGDWQLNWQAAAEMVCNRGKTLVAVVYADWQQAQAPSPKQVISSVPSGRGRFLLIDTYDKQKGPLFSHLSRVELAEILHLAKDASLQTVVAGGLSQASLPQLPQEGIDVIAVRGGVCDGDRTGLVNCRLVSDFRNSIQAHWS